VLTSVVRPVELYESVGCGRSHLLSASYFDLPHAVDAFRAAIEIDGAYAPAHAGLARARCAQAELRTVPHLEAFAEAETLALRALAIDSACIDAHVALGTVLFLRDWNWPAAERSLRRALALDPAHTEALVQYGALMEALGKLDEGLQFKQQALVRSPRSPWLLVQIATSYWHQRKHDETLVWAQRALDLDPTHLLAISLLSFVHWRRGDLVSFLEQNLRGAAPPGMSDEALTQLRQIVAEMRSVQASEGTSGVTRYMADAVNDPRLEFDPMLKLASRRAILYGDAGRLDDAFDYLDQAIAERDPALVYLSIAPHWDSLRGDLRFSQRLGRMTMPAMT
jgi:tetratricopeptide (TPR) repeat protein